MLRTTNATGRIRDESLMNLGGRGHIIIIQCGNYLWNKFSNFKTNDNCRKRSNRSIFIYDNAYFK
jgi:hypothetical protein